MGNRENETIHETMERFNDDSESEAGNMSLDEIADTEGLFSDKGEDLIKGNESKSVKQGQVVKEKPRNDLGDNQVEEKKQGEDVKNDLNHHKVQEDVKEDIVKETEETKVLSLEDWFQSFAEYRLDPELVGDKVENLHFNKNDDQAVTQEKEKTNGEMETEEVLVKILAVLDEVSYPHLRVHLVLLDVQLYIIKTIND